MKIIKRSPEGTNGVTRDFRNAVSDLFGRFFEDDFFSTDLVHSDFNPRVDLIEKENEIIVKADIPGIEEEDLKLEVEGERLTISGKKEEEKETKGNGYQRLERSFGSFSRVIQLPDSADPEKVQADYKKGVLTVKIQKKPETQPKKISVKVS